MKDALDWIAALGGVAATVGAWRSEATARWQARAEHLRTDSARRENELHRRRFTELWNWLDAMPPGPEKVAAARWYSEWTGVAAPGRGGLDPGPLTPGFGCANADEAYERYVGYLGAVYEPGRPEARARVMRRAATRLRRRSLRISGQGPEGGKLA